MGPIAQPGDKLVLTTPSHLTSDQAALLKQRVEGELPGVTVLILSSGLEVSAVYRPEHGAKETR